jgi:NAD(P)-dependent dehydrogenase (short-subunit alcohol dehydrogenase family)
MPSSVATFFHALATPRVPRRASFARQPARAPTRWSSSPSSSSSSAFANNDVDESHPDDDAVGRPDARRRNPVPRRALLAVPPLAALVSLPRPSRADDRAPAASDLAPASDPAVAPANVPPTPAKRTVLVLGATGRVGHAATLALLREGHDVRAVVRSAARLPADLAAYVRDDKADAAATRARLFPLEASVSDMSVAAMADAMRGADAVIQCLGHRLTFDGVFGEPRFLCRDAAALVFDAADAIDPNPAAEIFSGGGPEDTPESVAAAVAAATAARRPARFVLLGSAGADNPAGTDPERGGAEKLLVAAIAAAIPPFADTVAETRYLADRPRPRDDDATVMRWTLVRPDDFLDETVTPVETGWVLHERLQNGLLDAGVTSIVNIGACMARLAVADEPTWRRWEGKMPHLLDEYQPERT